jgi:hypothetical protein
MLNTLNLSQLAKEDIFLKGRENIFFCLHPYVHCYLYILPIPRHFLLEYAQMTQQISFGAEITFLQPWQI